MKISTKGRYALEAILYMAHLVGYEPVAIRQIADDTGISEKYLEQLFFALRKKGIISAVRGPKGGYYIARKFGELTAGEIVRALEGDLAPVPCLKENSECDFQLDYCITKGIWQKVIGIIDSVLDTTTIAFLLTDYERLIQEKKQQADYCI